MALREYAGGAVATTITNNLAATGAITINLLDTTGWTPLTGFAGKFLIVVDEGTASEEKMLVTTRATNTLTISAPDRAANGSSAHAHSSGAVIRHCLGSDDVSEPNTHIFGTPSGAHAGSAISFPASGTIGSGTVTGAIQELDSELNALITAITSTNWVTQARMADDSVGTAELINGNVTVAKLANPDALSLTAAAAANLAGATLTFTWDTEVSDPNGFIAVPSDTITVPATFAGLYVIVLKTSGSGVTNYPIILVNDGANSSYVGGVRGDARNNTTQTLRLAVGNTIKCFSVNTSGSSDNRSAALTLHRIAL